MRLWLLFAAALSLLSHGAAAQMAAAGKFTPGHTVRVLSPDGRVIGDAGGSAGATTPGSGYLTEMGVTNTGTPVCINDALINAPGGYHQLCMGAEAFGGYVVTANSYGGAVPQPLRFQIEGATYDFPGNGQGNTLWPNTSNMLDIAVWNNTTGTLLRGSDLGFKAAGALSGVLAPSPIDSQASPYSMIAVTDDTATNVSCPGGACSGIPALAVYHKFGGDSAGGGGRIGIWSNLIQDGDLPSNPIPFQTGIFSNVTALHGSNGGEFYGFAAQVDDEVGGHYAITGGEIDIALHSNTTQRKEGWSIASVPLVTGPDSQHGTLYDAALGIWAGGTCLVGSGAGGSGCAGFNMGISFGRDDGFIGVAPTGTLIGISPNLGGIGNPTVFAGIDFSRAHFAVNGDTTRGMAFASPGFAIDGAGDIFFTKPFPMIQFWEGFPSNTTGGKVRLIGGGLSSNDFYQWQINTSVAGDYSTSNIAFTINANGNVAFGSSISTVGAVTAGAGLVSQKGIIVGPPGPPGPPPPVGFFGLYVDPTTHHLIAGGSSGTLTDLAPP